MNRSRASFVGVPTGQLVRRLQAGSVRDQDISLSRLRGNDQAMVLRGQACGKEVQIQDIGMSSNEA